ncbi:MAG: hypothetical protein UR39_C0004G0070 [Candidatus Woesebacteria bacterium GW2011_GWA1_33_30]|uniref:Uncharacterized protein n=1 Tax=Candidatus Woesebacteria bacterium GW2011_GWA2_33_28 TaxID=1618561 RepID=A0A0G0C899_9BACT|nr:MAG: hypothetical protein UR38_C0004G0003 [Candidatus Woesebacteria bacterium GW2011_GWA2_33_28]KKP48449.1 MAG: hypothetical protein UR39_C0004G0070 [Candidatus Woesebacteria bacterium GW2011_GWA1_33_30]KKP49556.1 MAG: hypothetical protein UR40_C0005G0070 [Microgenomates group bacterium GW2011_GWC1_33_32]KKP52521.1 MAG: hypothetical protein UR44_C0002G0070 [Candidatus Woesebacteria bacterium GW2011_GWB1_33_38]KKP55927.1 MAG: hypothetical protein UR48_C0045G0006 [Microgenomates group bacteriu
MNSLNLKLILILSFFVFLFINRQSIFQKFDPEVVGRYLRSQDIEDIENKIKNRIFISDSDIYIAAGYLYVTGSEPVSYNFQHPPLIKYLFGLSAKYFNLPLLPNIIFAGVLLFEVYLLGSLVFKNGSVGLLASLFLLVDPVFKEVITYALLDLGQMVFILGFLIMSIKSVQSQGVTLLSGVMLGLAFASKFYSPVIIFLGLVYIFKLLNKQFNIKHELAILLIAFLVFSICYIKSWPFNIFFEQVKIVKFMLTHNSATQWGGVLPMFFGGYFLWPILFFVNLFAILKTKFTDPRFLVFLIPIFYFLILNFQLPFTRYFILILPFLYLSLTNFIVRLYSTPYKFKG